MKTVYLYISLFFVSAMFLYSSDKLDIIQTDVFEVDFIETMSTNKLLIKYTSVYNIHNMSSAKKSVWIGSNSKDNKAVETISIDTNETRTLINVLTEMNALSQKYANEKKEIRLQYSNIPNIDINYWQYFERKHLTLFFYGKESITIEMRFVPRLITALTDAINKIKNS